MNQIDKLRALTFKSILNKDERNKQIQLKGKLMNKYIDN